MLTDSHCHLGDEAFSEDRAATLARAAEAGVRRAVVIASDADDAEWIAGYVGSPGSAREGVALWGTAGIHPHHAGEATPEMLARIEALLTSGDAVAVGECGLDFHYDHAPRRTQIDLARAQCEIAERTGRPLVVHTRSAESETRALLAGLPDGVRGVLHCFTGSEDLLREALTRGWYISFSGIVTFRRYTDAGVVRSVPEDRILIETDSPYLAPVPHRGRRNEPAHLVATCEVVAGMREVSFRALAEATTRNAATLFGLDGVDP
ncbi:MAG: TatD family hydrolase [Longimicrobiales bacterium]|nr:TatD family hydrolase [Longimicrobiales bacterium]